MVGVSGHLAEDDTDVAAAEAERVRERGADRLFAGFVGDVAEVALGVGVVEVDGRAGSPGARRRRGRPGPRRPPWR